MRLVGHLIVGLVVVGLAGVAQSAAVTPQRMKHPAFKEAGKTTGLEIWRVENFEPVPVPKADYGKFFQGDSYIVLNTVAGGKNKDSFSWDLHYWLGSKSSQDETGAAAILAVELDDGLGGGPVQHREIESHESPLFSSYFKQGVRYVSGGVASGFRHAVTNDSGPKRLYQVKGKKSVRVREVEASIKSMNKGDCFILDHGDIWIWVGPQAQGSERVKAITAANQIRDQDHGGRSKVNIVDASSTEDEVNTFFTKLGAKDRQIADAASGGDDAEFEKKQDGTVTLYKVTDAGGSIVSEKIGQKPLNQAQLDTKDSFVLDTVTSGIYVWIGKQSTTHEKVEALKRGSAFIASQNYPPWTRMQRVVEGAEPASFREYFSNWKDSAKSG